MKQLRFRRVCCASDLLGTPGALTWSVLGVFWRTSWAHSGCSLVRLPGSLLIRVILFYGRALCSHKLLDTGLLVCTGCISSPSSLTFIGGLLGLLKALAEVSIIDCYSVGNFTDCQTRCAGRRSCKTPVLPLFVWQMLLVLLLLGVGGGEEIKF